MKISLNWLKTYLTIDLSPQEVSEILTGIGLEEEGMERVESIEGGLEGVVVGQVTACGPHPDADRLSLTQVDIGNGEALQIVCGAPNVAQGQKVLVATVGTTLYPTGSEAPLTLKKGKIRGQVSEGMICAEDELGMGTSHDGILVLPEDTPVGTLAKDYFQVEVDYVYDIGLTPNRSDATNHLGVAKDLAAYLKINHGYTKGVNVPDVAGFQTDHNELPVSVTVADPDSCPRYAGLTLTGLSVKPSPEWLQNRLRSIGLRPINNIVDATNFVLHELGQPLHAFDLDKIGGREIVVQTLPEGTAFTTLDEAERKLSAEDLMICNGKGEGLCMAGVFGGLGSGVTDSTTSIFLESAHFNAKQIRRTSMKYNLRTDAAKVFEKGSDPNVVVYALKRAAMLIKELAGGEIGSELIDLYPHPVKRAEVAVRYAHVSRLIGVEIPKADIHSILQALEMEVVADNETTFTVAVPTNKTDVTREADVIEEILRIYGYNRVPDVGQVKTSLNVAPQPDPALLQDKIGDFLAAHGFCEMMALSLSRSMYYKETIDSFQEEQLVYINNTSNAQLDIMRPDMLFSGLEAIVHNQNRQQSRLKLFEFGRTYQRGEDGAIAEQQHLSLFMAGERWPESWLNADKNETAGFYSLKAFVEGVLARLGVSAYQSSPVEAPGFAFGLHYHRGPQTLVRFGQISPKLAKAMGLRGQVGYADFNWDALLKSRKKYKMAYAEVNKFPVMRRDLALVVDNSIKFSDIAAVAQKAGKKMLQSVNLFDVYENEEQLGKGKKSYALSLVFENPEKTLKDKEVDKVMQKLIDDCQHQFGAAIRQ